MRGRGRMADLIRAGLGGVDDGLALMRRGISDGKKRCIKQLDGGSSRQQRWRVGTEEPPSE